MAIEWKMLTRPFLTTRLGISALLVGVCAVALAASDENDWLIIPGKRVGPILPNATRADLNRIFGAKNVDEDEILKSDFGTETGTRVYGTEPTASLAIFWKSDAADSRIRRIRFCSSLDSAGNKCKWRTAEGITLGTSLKELEKLNGQSFQLNGFDWGFGGLITSWNGGRLEKLSASCGGMLIRLDPPSGPPSDERSHLMDVVEGDEEFASSNPAMQSLNPVVDFMSLSFQNCK